MESGVQNVFWHIPTRSNVLRDEQLTANIPNVYEHDTCYRLFGQTVRRALWAGLPGISHHGVFLEVNVPVMWDGLSHVYLRRITDY